MMALTVAGMPVCRLRRFCLATGVLWLATLVFCWSYSAQQFYRSYLFAWLFWLGISVGCLGIVMLHHLIGGNWGIAIRRIGENASAALFILIPLFIPIAVGIPSLFTWSQAVQLRDDALLRHLSSLFNYPCFIARASAYMLIWNWLALTLRRDSLRFDQGRDPVFLRRAYDRSAFGMVLLFVTVTFASIDWMISRESHWFSTIFGLTTVIGQAISGLCFMIFILTLLRKQRPFFTYLQPDHFNDLGNILLTLVILWTYLGFAQLLVIWMGNKQDEIPWYIARLSNGWLGIGVTLLVLHFVVPFTILLIRDAKRAPALMQWLCILLLVMRAVDLFWTVAPSGAGIQPLVRNTISWMDILFPIGMGALWFGWFLWLAERNPIMIDSPDPLPAEPLVA